MKQPQVDGTSHREIGLRVKAAAVRILALCPGVFKSVTKEAPSFLRKMMPRRLTQGQAKQWRLALMWGLLWLDLTDMSTTKVNMPHSAYGKILAACSSPLFVMILFNSTMHKRGQEKGPLLVPSTWASLL